MTTPDPDRKVETKNEYVKNESETDDFREALKKEGIQGLYGYAKSNTRDTIAYVVLIIGVILLFFDPSFFWGGLLVGLVVGFYFASEILGLIKHFNDVIAEQGVVRSLVFGGLMVAFFISAPGIFIGAAVGVAIKKLISPEAIS